MHFFLKGTCRGICPSMFIESGQCQKSADEMSWKKNPENVQQWTSYFCFQNFGQYFSRLNEHSMHPAETRGNVFRAPKGILLPGTPYCFVVIQTSQPHTCLCYRKRRQTTHSEWETQHVKITLLTSYKLAPFENHKLWDKCRNPHLAYVALFLHQPQIYHQGFHGSALESTLLSQFFFGAENKDITMSQHKLVDLCLGRSRKPSPLQTFGWLRKDLAITSLCLPEQNLLLLNPYLSQ